MCTVSVRQNDFNESVPCGYGKPNQNSTTDGPAMLFLFTPLFRFCFFLLFFGACDADVGIFPIHSFQCTLSFEI